MVMIDWPEAYGEKKSFYLSGYFKENLDNYIKGVLKKNTSAAFIIDGRSGLGKCQTKGSKICLSNGHWKKVEDVKVGDEIISPQKDGSFSHEKVTEIHTRFEKEIYDVCERNRDKRKLYSCAFNHQIPFFRTQTNRIKKGDGKRKSKMILDCKTAEELSKRNKYYRVSSFSSSAIEYKQIDSSMDPYTLGVWIGDGNFTDQLSITSGQLEIMEPILDKFKSMKNYDRNNATQYRFSKLGDLAKQLRRLGLKDKKSGEKFIPTECLLSSIQYRLKLLAGLIDTDGYVMKKRDNHISYCTKSKQLSEDVKNLVFSLGGYSRIRKITKSCQGGFTGDYFNISISFKDPRKIPLRNKFKKERIYREMKHDPRHIQIKCVKGKPDYVYGFSITGNSKWYVTDNWMVTHNSTLACQLGCYIIQQNRIYMRKEKRTPQFTLDSLCWTPEKLLEILKKAQKGDVIILDESMILSNRSAMSEMNKAVVIMMSMIRSKQIFVIFCANSLFDLERNLPLHRADLLVHLYAINDKFASRGRYFVVPSAKGRLKFLYIHGKKFYDYSRAWPAFRDHFSGWFPFDPKEYEKRKQHAITNYFEAPRSRSAEKHMVQRNKLIIMAYKSGIHKQKIMEATGLTRRPIEEIILNDKLKESK